MTASEDDAMQSNKGTDRAAVAAAAAAAAVRATCLSARRCWFTTNFVAASVLGSILDTASQPCTGRLYDYIDIRMCVSGTCADKAKQTKQSLLAMAHGAKSDAYDSIVKKVAEYLYSYIHLCATHIICRGVTQPSRAPRHFLRSGPLPSDFK